MSEKKSVERMIWPASTRAGRRRLTEEEERLWAVVARSIKPLRAGKRVPMAAVPKLSPPKLSPPKLPPPKLPPQSARPVKRAAADHPPAAAAPHPKPPASAIAIARREKQQLARGKTEIGGRIDLHGMTQAQAHDALLHFLHRYQAEGAKFVLVITGKGGAGAVARGERGVLRRQVPLWLGLAEFRVCVLGFDTAHVGHGGDGALYVRLRKARGAA
jgi:DNA-nicking Smr family endonuclease